MVRKKCAECSLRKPLDLFYAHPKTADGYMALCKECHKSGVKKNREANKEHYLEFDRKRAFRPDRVAARQVYQEGRKSDPELREIDHARSKEWALANAEKRTAHNILNNAVRDGKIKKPKKCSVCGVSPRKIHGHHGDYSRPLAVMWVCVSCHGKIHRRFEV